MVTTDRPENQKAEGLMKYADAAAYLQVPESTVRWWVKRKEIPFKKVGRHTRFRREELDQWVDESRAA